MGWNPIKSIKKAAGKVSSWVGGVPGFAYNAITGGDWYNDLTGRTDKEREAREQKKRLEYQRDTILGQMERELAIKKQEAQEWTDSVRLEASQTEGRLEQGYGTNQQNAYLETIAAEANFQNTQANTARHHGALGASRAASGLRNTGSVADLIGTEQANASAAEGRARAALDYGISSMVSGNMINRQAGMDQIGAVRTKADQTMAQFDSGSAYMNLYHYKRSRVTGETAMQTSYLDRAIDDLYSFKGYLGDALRMGAGAASGFATGGPAGAILGGASAIFA